MDAKDNSVSNKQQNAINVDSEIQPTSMHSQPSTTDDSDNSIKTDQQLLQGTNTVEVKSDQTEPEISHRNNISRESEVQKNESLVFEHSYANVKDTLSSENTSLDLNNEPSDTRSALPMDISEDTSMSAKLGQKQSVDIDKVDCIPEISNEVIVTEELITIDNEHSKDFIKRKNTRNINLNNETGPKLTEDIYYIDTNTSLGAIALQYDSSDLEDLEDEDTEEIITDVNYRNKINVVTSSDESSDSESDSSSSSSESDSETSSNDSSEEKEATNKPNKSKTTNQKKSFSPKNELDDLPPIEDLKISVPEVLCDPMGEVAWMVEQIVVVRPKAGKPTLNLDTVLFIDKGKRALGHIFDVFGQVSEPHYSIRFNSSEHIQKSDIKVGMTVYYCPNSPYTSLVFLSELTKMKAAEDVGDDEQPEFSDDEEEQAYLASLRKKSSNNKQANTSNENPNKRRKDNKSNWQSDHPWNSNRAFQQHNSLNTRPFYRTQHPWSRPRHPSQNPWHQYTPYQHNFMMVQPSMHTYNAIMNHAHMQTPEMQNGYPHSSWNYPQYPLPRNPMSQQELPQTSIPVMSIPPPPPPPLPPPNGDKK